MSASVKPSRELAKEQLVLLGWKEEQWNVLDNVSVRNLQNGLVSFELTEHFERCISQQDLQMAISSVEHMQRHSQKGR